MGVMERPWLNGARALTLGLLGAAALSGCGSKTQTVTAGSTPPAVATTATSAQSTGTGTTSTAPTTTGGAGGTATSTTGGTAAPGTTRSAPEPAFTEQEGARAGGVSAAAATVRAKGYTPNDTSEFHQGQTLQVLVGTRTGSGDGYGQRAFFFVNGRYIGTDAGEPSAAVKVLSQGDTEVTLAYPLYRPNDALCCPSGGQATVHFQLNNGKLTALQPIPPASSKSGLSRY
jgi:LppP/LprE lipoprotein